MRKAIGLCICLLFSCSWLAAAEEGAAPGCTGKVVDADGAAVADAAVRIYAILDEDGVFRVSLAGETRTAPDGSFVLQGTGADFQKATKAVVTAEKKGLALGWSAWHLYDRQDLETVITLAPPASVSGTVVDENGAPVAGARVRACVKALPYAGAKFAVGLALAGELAATTDEAGAFSLGNVPVDSSFEFLASAAGRARVLTGPLRGGAARLQFAPGRRDIRIVLPGEAKIEGKVVELETGEAKAGVRLVVAPVETAGNPFAARAAVSGEDGTFKVGGLAGGDHTVRLAASREQARDLLASPVSVTAAPGGTSRVTFGLESAATLEVFVRDEKTNAPLAGAVITLGRRVREAAQSTPLFQTAGEDGVARFRLASGEYVVRSAGVKGYQDAKVDRVVVLESRKTSGVDVALVRVDKITGTVLDEAGDPVAGARVEVGPGSFHPGLRSDESGAFEVSWKPPRFKDDRPIEPYVVARLVERNLAVRMMLWDIREPVEVRMAPGVKLLGRVVDPAGGGLARATVTLWFKGDEWSPPIDPSFVKADGQGRYEIEAIPDGCDYTVTGEAFGYGTNAVTFGLYGKSGQAYEVADVVLPPADKSIAGVVVDEDGKAIPGARVRARNRRGLWVDARSDREGKFRIEELIEGAIEIRAASGDLICEYASAKTGEENVKVVLRQYAARRAPAPPRRPPSLLGLQLPDLAEVAPDFDVAAAEGKPVLVCFFDTQQRPSRHVVKKLAEMAQDLAKKNVSIVAIDTSGSNADSVKEWAGENEIPFPVVRGAEDAETTRMNWGVDALPWLILADESRTVRAEGFSLEEVDKRVAEITGD